MIATLPQFDVETTCKKLEGVIHKTPLQYHKRLSEKYECRIWLKREDMQIGRSYKIRGAYNKISSLPASSRNKGIVCASAGNHAQGVAYSCKHLNVQGNIFMPVNTVKSHFRPGENEP